MLELSHVNCCPGSMLSYSEVNFVAPSDLSSSIWLASSLTGMGGWDNMPGVWKFILLNSTGSEGAITLAFCISNPDMRGVITWAESIGCLSGCRLRLKTMKRTTSRASPIPATTGPTTHTKLVLGVWDGKMSQYSSPPLQSPGVAGGRVAEGVYGSEIEKLLNIPNISNF